MTGSTGYFVISFSVSLSLPVIRRLSSALPLRCSLRACSLPHSITLLNTLAVSASLLCLSIDPVIHPSVPPLYTLHSIAALLYFAPSKATTANPFSTYYQSPFNLFLAFWLTANSNPAACSPAVQLSYISNHLLRSRFGQFNLANSDYLPLGNHIRWHPSLTNPSNTSACFYQYHLQLPYHHLRFLPLLD